MFEVTGAVGQYRSVGSQPLSGFTVIVASDWVSRERAAQLRRDEGPDGLPDRGFGV